MDSEQSGLIINYKITIDTEQQNKEKSKKYFIIFLRNKVLPKFMI